MSARKPNNKKNRETDPDSMSLIGKIAAVFLLLLFALYMFLKGS